MATPPTADPSARSSDPLKRSRPAPPPADPSPTSSTPAPSKRSRPAPPPPPVLRPSPSEPTRPLVITEGVASREPSMADAGASTSGTGAGGNDEMENRYFGDFTSRFVLRHQTWAKENHTPQTEAEYEESLKTNQTNTCTNLAASQYQKDKGVVFEKVKGVDSHVFQCKWLSPDDKRLCFHVNFWALVVGGRKQGNLFFSEIVGSNSPQFVNTCVILEKLNSSLNNCGLCTGMWHPSTACFLGCKNRPAPG